MSDWEVLDELVRVGAAGGGAPAMAQVLERLSLDCYLGIYLLREPAEFCPLLTRRAERVLGREGVAGVSRALSEMLMAPEAEAGAPQGGPRGRDPVRPVEILRPGPPSAVSSVLAYPVVEADVVLGGVLATPPSETEAAALEQLGQFVQVLLSRASLAVQNRTHQQALEFLNDVYRANLEQQEAGAISGVELTLSRLADLFHFDAAALALPDQDRWKVFYWVPAESPPSFVEVLREQTLAELSREHGAAEPSVAQSVLWQNRPVAASGQLKLHFVLPFQFEAGGRRPGQLSLYSTSEDLLTPDEMRLLVLLTPGLSIAFRNSQLLLVLERQAKIDEMSGLYNYRTFRALLGREFQRLARYGTPLSLLMLDIDFFKKINDTFGHQKGDEALRAVAGLLLESKRGVDAVARYGGEEFTMILPETDLDGAVQVAERVRKYIASRPLLPDRPLTVSIGVATFADKNAGTEDDLIHRADQALYRAKTGGRNRVEA